MNGHNRPRVFETHWPLRQVKRLVRLAKAKAYADMLDAFNRGDGEHETELAKAHARRRVRELRGEK